MGDRAVLGVSCVMVIGVWSTQEYGIDHLAAIVKNRLKRIQYRPDLIDAFFAHTGLNLETEPP
ncbi:hypothetical protein F4560_004094 [Saccharothrix ecbatanensis]|uniref:Uncharacterized protein n=1 Tax=Saccharothrix ecbatanensis TaxID=1105145 RepID=A0A7W9M1W7_9PSEU|nr:hypothetical protein [Saccharothrix ecbatanensis]MBB5804326.1 hypothetical protein [Saccharothrix ecbatanensis]